MFQILENDLKRILREPFLILMLFVPILAGVAVRFGMILLDPFIPFLKLMDFDFIITPFTVLFIGLMYGAVVGLMLLDEKDENTLIAMFVTPMGRKGYFFTRVITLMCVTIIYGLVLSYILSFKQPTLLTMLCLSIIVAFEAPLSALTMVTFAKNKVEGLAIMKLYSFFVLTPIIMYFIPKSLEWIFVWNPYYFPIKIFEVGMIGGNMLLTFLLGLAVHAVYILMLLKRFENQVI